MVELAASRTDVLTKRYSGGFFRADVTAVDNLELEVQEGEVYGFLGPNGAGKSTSIDMLLDYARPTEEPAEILGHDVQQESEAVSELVGVLPEGYGYTIDSLDVAISSTRSSGSVLTMISITCSIESVWMPMMRGVRLATILRG